MAGGTAAFADDSADMLEGRGEKLRGEEFAGDQHDGVVRRLASLAGGRRLVVGGVQESQKDILDVSDAFAEVFVCEVV